MFDNNQNWRKNISELSKLKLENYDDFMAAIRDVKNFCV